MPAEYGKPYGHTPFGPEHFYPDIRKPRELRSIVEQFPGVFWGHETVKSFEKSIEDRVLKNPKHSQVFLALGEPGSGKSSVQGSILNHLLRPRGRISNFIERNNANPRNQRMALRIDEISWGAPFLLIPEEFRLEGIDYHRSLELMAKKQEEVNMAATIWSDALALDLLRYWQFPEQVLGTNIPSFSTADKDTQYIHFVIADVGVNTGTIINGEQYGILRGFYELRELMQKSGRFTGLQYDTHVMGIAAHPDVREHAKQIRKVQFDETIENIEERVELLKEQGVILDTTDKEQLAEFGKDHAPVGEILLIEKDVDLTNVALIMHDKTLRSRKTRSDYEKENLVNQYLTSPRVRTEFIGQEQLKYFANKLGVAPSRGIILYNKQKLSEVPVHVRHIQHQPVAELAKYLPFR